GEGGRGGGAGGGGGEEGGWGGRGRGTGTKSCSGDRASVQSQGRQAGAVGILGLPSIYGRPAVAELKRRMEMLFDRIDRHRDELLRFAARLVATPSPNPPGDERAVVQVILAEMEQL